MKHQVITKKALLEKSLEVITDKIESEMKKLEELTYKRNFMIHSLITLENYQFLNSEESSVVEEFVELKEHKTVSNITSIGGPYAEMISYTYSIEEKLNNEVKS